MMRSTVRQTGARPATKRARVTAVKPARPVQRALARRGAPEWLPLTLGLASAALMLAATVGWPMWSALVGRVAADVHHYQAREAMTAGQAPQSVQQHLLAAIAADPRHHAARLDLARAYLEMEWYGGAIAQAEAVLKARRSRQEASLAYTYMGYGHYMLKQTDTGLTELQIAAQFDPTNALAQSLLERIERQGALPVLKNGTIAQR